MEFLGKYYLKTHHYCTYHIIEVVFISTTGSIRYENLYIITYIST